MPGTTDVLKRFPSIMRDPLTFLLDMSYTYGDSVPFNLPEERARLINHPDLIEHVLLTNNKNYSKKTVQFETFAYVTGDGLLNSDGDFWLRQRRIAQPAFHQRKIKRMVDVMQEETVKKVADWQEKQRQGINIDMEQEMLQLTLGITMKALFHKDVGGQEAELVHIIEETLGYVMFRAQVLVPIPPSWPLPVNNRFRHAIKELDELIYGMISRRRRENPDVDDVLSLFINARDENGHPIPDQLIRDEVLTLIIAGYETAASGMTWLWALLDQNPEMMARLQDEVRGLNGRPPNLEEFAKLPFLNQAIHEGWRLYPPSWVISRQVIEDDVIGGEPIEAGTLVIMSPYTIHRHPGIWPDPHSFKPERFKDGVTGDGRSRYAYIPFGGGPRLCIGNTFAEMETMIIMGTLAQQFAPQLLSDDPIEHRALVTIRPRGGLPMRL